MNENILSKTSLLPYNTFRVDANAKFYTPITQEQELKSLYHNDTFNAPFLTLGGGSNVLFTKDFDGTVVHVKTKGIQHFIEGNFAYVTASGGEVWNDFVWYCIDHNFPGVENMALIPGTVGASPVQNIGAYGTELMDIFYSCRAFDTTSGTFQTFTNEQCRFSYRDSIFKNEYKSRYIITSVTYKLNLRAALNTSYGAIEAEIERRGIVSPTIRDVANVVSSIRVEKLPDPSTIGNAGSFFKNPIIPTALANTIAIEFPTIVRYATADENFVKVAAGWLIEQCGWKGKQVGQVLIWPKQALVITNAGLAKGSEIYNVSSMIIESVQQKFGILLEREVNIL